MDEPKSAIFPLLTGNALFGQIWSKKLKLLIEAEIQYLDQLEYAEFTGGVHFLHFLTENILFLTNLVPKFIIAYCEISKMQNSMVMFTFYIFIAGSALFGQI